VAGFGFLILAMQPDLLGSVETFHKSENVRAGFWSEASEQQF
jgi:hypothetical protein